MAYDGTAVACIAQEIERLTLGGRIDKVYQPEKDEIVLTIRSLGKVCKLLITANPSQPRINFTDKSSQNPTQPPLFCMVLRKYIASGKITAVKQPSFERILEIEIDSMDEMGDYSVKKLIVEIMGRHSNIILTDSNGIILDCAKHITHETSSVREVLPGKEYVYPPSQGKLNPLELEKNQFMNVLGEKDTQKIQSAIYGSYSGISPFCASEICYRAGVDASSFTQTLSQAEKDSIFNKFLSLMQDIKSGNFKPQIIYDGKGGIIDFSPTDSHQFAAFKKDFFDSLSVLLEAFYKNKDLSYRIGQKTQSLKKIVTQHIERCSRKKDIQAKTMREIKDREKLRLYGELLTANIYAVKSGEKSFTAQNFYDEKLSEVTIPLDPQLSAVDNAQRYFKKYNKQKRTFAALQEQIKSNDDELEYLDAVLSSLSSLQDEQDITQVRQELAEQGFIKKAPQKKAMKTNRKAKPMHFLSCDGFDIYVGKNNKQNDELTLKTAKNNDIWFHTKNIPGSHVIVITNGKSVPNSTLNEAAMLAAFYSKAKNSALVPVDYTIRKNVKKPNGAKPGMVIYETNETAYVTPSEDAVNSIKSV